MFIFLIEKKIRFKKFNEKKTTWLINEKKSVRNLDNFLKLREKFLNVSIGQSNFWKRRMSSGAELIVQR